MKKSSIIWLMVIFSFFTPFFIFTPVTGISFTYTRYWFYIEGPQVLEYNEMQFTVKNNQAIPKEIVCSYQNIEGITLDVIFDWTRQILNPGESIKNHYTINITSALATTFNLDIYLQEKPLGASDNQLLAGGIIANKIIFYSENEGSVLDLRITDQADRPRTAQTIIKYSVNASMPYTPIKDFNNSAFLGLLPYGNYMVQAYDLVSPVYGEEFFTLNTTNQQVTVRLALVGFKRFKIEQSPSIGINTTLFNHVEQIELVRVYAELYQHHNDGSNELLETTIAWEISPLPMTTSQYIMLWFGYEKFQTDTDYMIKGIIEADDIPIAYEETGIFTILSTTNSTTTLYGNVVVTILGLWGVWIIITQIRKRKVTGD